MRCRRSWASVRPDERAAGERVGVRAALARQVGQEQQPVAAGRGLRRLVDQLAERHARRHGVAEPAQAAGGREHHRHHVPAIRHGVAEGVDPARGLEQRLVGRREHHARRPQRQRHAAGHHGAHPDRVGRLVAAARHDRRPGAQAGRLGAASRTTVAGHRRPLERRRHPRRVDPQRLEHHRRPVAGGEVEQDASRRRRPCRARTRRSAGSGRSPWAAARGRRGPRSRARAPRTQASLGAVKPVSASLPVISTRRCRADGRADRVALGGRALVVPQDRRPQDLARGVEQHEAVHLAR